jgi:hypothetical protein
MSRAIHLLHGTGKGFHLDMYVFSCLSLPYRDPCCTVPVIIPPVSLLPLSSHYPCPRPQQPFSSNGHYPTHVSATVSRCVLLVTNNSCRLQIIRFCSTNFKHFL